MWTFQIQSRLECDREEIKQNWALNFWAFRARVLAQTRGKEKTFVPISISLFNNIFTPFFRLEPPHTHYTSAGDQYNVFRREIPSIIDSAFYQSEEEIRNIGLSDAKFYLQLDVETKETKCPKSFKVVQFLDTWFTVIRSEPSSTKRNFEAKRN